MKQIKMYMPKGTYFKKTKKVALTLIGFIALIIILINGIYIPIWLIWVGIGYALCPITAYLYLKTHEYYEKKKRGKEESKKENENEEKEEEYKPKHAKKEKV